MNIIELSMWNSPIFVENIRFLCSNICAVPGKNSLLKTEFITKNLHTQMPRAVARISGLWSGRRAGRKITASQKSFTGLNQSIMIIKVHAWINVN